MLHPRLRGAKYRRLPAAIADPRGPGRYAAPADDGRYAAPAEPKLTLPSPKSCVIGGRALTFPNKPVCVAGMQLKLIKLNWADGPTSDDGPMGRWGADGPMMGRWAT